MEKNFLLQKPLQSQFFAKPVNKDDSAKVGKVLLSDGNLNFSESFGHKAQCSLLVKVLPDLFYY